MKYKIGDKVKIKTWIEMEKEYGLQDFRGHIKTPEAWFLSLMEEQLNNLNTDRVLTIKIINEYYYKMEEIGHFWYDSMIECLLIEEILEPILSRFEILDL